MENGHSRPARVHPCRGALLCARTKLIQRRLERILVEGNVGLSRKRVLIGFLSIIALGVALLVGVVGWIGWKGRLARQRAEQLCAAFPAGVDAEPFARRAHDLGLRSMPAMSSSDHPEGDVSVQTAYDAVMLARWFCTVEIAGGKVLTSKVAFLD